MNQNKMKKQVKQKKDQVKKNPMKMLNLKKSIMKRKK